MKNNPAKWYEVYKGSAEKRFFVGIDGKSGLVRGRDGSGKCLTWRSVEGLVKDSGLSTKQVETLIQQYFDCGIVVNSPKNKEHWAYWQNVDVSEKPASISETDQTTRVKAAGGPTMTSTKKKTGSTPVGQAGTSGASAQSPSTTAPAAP